MLAPELKEINEPPKFIYLSNELARRGYVVCEDGCYEEIKISALEKDVLTYVISLMDRFGSILNAIAVGWKGFWIDKGILPRSDRYKEMFRQAVQNLRDKSATKKFYNNSGDSASVSISYFQRFIEIGKESGNFLIWMDPVLERDLIGLQENMTKYLPKHLYRLKKIYSKKMYELFCSLEYLGILIVLTIEELQKRMGTNYKKPSEFITNVIIPAIEEINAASLDIFIEYEVIKTGRTITQVAFKVKRLFGECASVGEDIQKAAIRELQQQLDYNFLLENVADKELLDRAIRVMADAKVHVQQKDIVYAHNFGSTIEKIDAKLNEIDRETFLLCLQSAFGERLAQNPKAGDVFLSRLLCMDIYVTVDDQDKEFENIRYQIRYEDILADIKTQKIGSKAHLDVIVRAMRGVIYQPKKNYQFWKGTEDEKSIPGNILRDIFKKLTYTHVVFALKKASETGKAISSPTKYFLTVLYEAYFSAFASMPMLPIPSVEDNSIKQPKEKISYTVPEKIEAEKHGDLSHSENGSSKGMARREAEDLVKKMLSYDWLTCKYRDTPVAVDAVNLLVEGVADVYSCTEARIMVNKTPMLPEALKDVFDKLNISAVENVIERFLAYHNRIEKPENSKNYLLSSIYSELVNPTVNNDDFDTPAYMPPELQDYFAR